MWFLFLLNHRLFCFASIGNKVLIPSWVLAVMNLETRFHLHPQSWQRGLSVTVPWCLCIPPSAAFQSVWGNQWHSTRYRHGLGARNLSLGTSMASLALKCLLIPLCSVKPPQPRNRGARAVSSKAKGRVLKWVPATPTADESHQQSRHLPEKIRKALDFP